MAFRLLLLLLCIISFAQAQDLSYQISPIWKDSKVSLEVAVQWEAKGTDFTNLYFANNQFGEGDQMAFLSFPENNPTFAMQPDSNRFVVSHAKEGLVTFRYQIYDMQENKPFYEYCCYKPIIKKDYFHIGSGHLLAYPEDLWQSRTDKKKVKFIWKGFPADWVIHNSFGPDSIQVASLMNYQLNSAIFVGGDFRRLEAKLGGEESSVKIGPENTVPLYFSTRGSWKNVHEDSIFALLRTVFQGHRAFWKDFQDTLYSVTFLPIDDAPWTEHSKMTSLGGSCLTNSFMSYATNHAGLDYPMLRYLFTHELLHHWIGNSIKNEEEEKQYWFSEGFTDYFTLKNMLNYGLMDENEWRMMFNDDFVIPHYSSTTKSQPNDSLNYEKFWNGGKDWEKLPYRRGCLYAFYLDNQLRQTKGSKKNLDDLMREILVHAQQNPDFLFNHGYFKDLLLKNLGKGAVKDFERYVERGKPINFSKTKLPEGLQCVLKPVKMSYGPSKDIIEKTVDLGKLPAFTFKTGYSKEKIRKAIIE